MRVIGVDLLKACIRAYSVLWPGSEQCKSVAELAICLQGSETRLRDWRHSAARAGADEVLAWALFWYEEMDLNVLQA